MIAFYRNFRKTTFHYDSNLWGDKTNHNLAGGMTGFDLNETKLPTYWNTPFSKICLGMKIGQQINFIAIDKTANSLYSLIADGQYRNTALGLDTWKKLICSNASLQTNCTKEGFNAASAFSKARIGILGNEQVTVTALIQESGLALEDILMTVTRVETRQMVTTFRIMEKNTSRPWGTYWCNDSKSSERRLQGIIHAFTAVRYCLK